MSLEDQLRRAALFGDSTTLGVTTSPEDIDLFVNYTREVSNTRTEPISMSVRQIFEHSFSTVVTYTHLIELLEQVQNDTASQDGDPIKNLASAYTRFLEVCTSLMGKLRVNELQKFSPNTFIKMLTFYLQENEHQLLNELKSSKFLSATQLAEQLFKIAKILDHEKEHLIRIKLAPRRVV